MKQQQNPPPPHGKHAKRCEGKTPDGKRCKRQALPGGRFCHAHDPERREALREAGRKGGSVSRRPELPQMDALTVEEARQLLAGVVAGVLTGKLSEGIGKAVGYLLATDARIREGAELEARLTRLEEEVQRNESQSTN